MNKWKCIVAGIGVILAVFIIGLLGKWESSYEHYAFVESINDGVTTFTDSSGNLWNYESEEFAIGEHVILTLRDTGTSLIQDDVITGIRIKID